jgi:hypothetical protein
VAFACQERLERDGHVRHESGRERTRTYDTSLVERVLEPTELIAREFGSP